MAPEGAAGALSGESPRATIPVGVSPAAVAGVTASGVMVADMVHDVTTAFLQRRVIDTVTGSFTALFRRTIMAQCSCGQSPDDCTGTYCQHSRI